MDISILSEHPLSIWPLPIGPLLKSNNQRNASHPNFLLAEKVHKQTAHTLFVIASCSPSPLSSLFIRKYAQIYRINSILASRSVEYRSFSITPIIRRLGCNIHIRLESIFRTIGHHANASLGAQVEWLSNGEFSELRRRSHEIKRQYTLLLCYNMFQPIDFHARPCVLGARTTWSAI